MPGKSHQRSHQSNVVVNVHRRGSVGTQGGSQSNIPINRGSSNHRTQARSIKQQAVSQALNAQISRPRPVVRPTKPPQRVMTKTAAKTYVRPVRPVASPSASAKLQAIQNQSPTSMRRQTGAGAIKTSRESDIAGLAPAAFTLNAVKAHADISAEVNALISSLDELIRRSTLSETLSDAQALDENIKHGLSLLESARDKRYVFQKDLEEIAYKSSDQWESMRQDVLAAIEERSKFVQSRIKPLGSDVRTLNLRINNPSTALPVIKRLKSKVDDLLAEVNQVQRNIEDRYDDIESAIYRMTTRLTAIHWAISQLDEAKFALNDHEYLYVAVQARWDKEDKDDPEGILFLTDQRLIFEQKEKVAKKKVLFISVDKEFIHEVLIDKPINNIKSVKAENKGLFGHQDFIQVEFSDPDLGDVSFHLDGQDSKDWVKWIDKARSGKIADDRVTGGGLSVSDITGPLTKADILAVQNEVNQLQDDLMLTAVRHELAAIENDMRELERKLSSLRARGYMLEKNLESDISILAMQWDRIKQNAESTLELQAQLLNKQREGIQDLLARLAGRSDDLQAARPMYIQLKSEIASAEAQAEASEDAVITQYDEYANEVESLAAYLEWIEWMLDALATASFRLLATESGCAATEAIWERPGLEPENGILFLTDQRLLWEDRVDTYELRLDIPLKNVMEVKGEVDAEKGQQDLVFTLEKSMPYTNLVFQLDIPVVDSWLKMVGRARSGDYVKDRHEEIDRAEVERIKNAPTQCIHCGAVYTSPILRGQKEITCEYCGTIVRI